MLDSVLNFLSNGITGWSVGTILIYLLIVTHITIIAVTVYLHRCQAHRGMELHASVSHFFRLWLWITTGMTTKEWVAIHRKHHATCETPEDPHSPKHYGIRKLLLQGTELYRAAATRETVERYGHGTPNDAVERKVYSKHRRAGIVLLLFINIALFGALGISVWAIQMAWIPFWAAGMINGTAHYIGYRNFETPDQSTNISPIAFWIGGEELHNNHHAFPSSAKFSIRWWEFDIGWMYIRLLSFMGLAKVKRVAPKICLDQRKDWIDLETLKSLITNRVNVMADYARRVIMPVVKTSQPVEESRFSLRRIKRLLTKDHSMMDSRSEHALKEVLDQHEALNTVYRFRINLQQIWERAAASHENLMQALKEWCALAEASGIKALQDFARRLRSHSAPVTATT